MRLLILGGDGMLGHQLLKHFSSEHEVAVTVREPLETYQHFGLFNARNTFDGIEAQAIKQLEEVVKTFRPDAVVNCIGIVKQRPLAEDFIASLEVNALLPHRLAVLCKDAGARLIHISTDCVFSGRKGNYGEADMPDAEDLYGRTKLLGEVFDTGCITLRTSIIGRELARKTSLLEWALAQTGKVKGFRSAIFSGFTTIELARIIERVLLEHTDAHGVYQVSSDPIDKFSLMQLIQKHLNGAIEVVPDDELKIDRSLNSSRFREKFNYKPPLWETMIGELAVSKPLLGN